MAYSHILIGICGGIAAYKTAELVRLLRKKNHEVRIVMTKAATQFISPLTLQALSGQPVSTELLDSDQENAMGHIELARWADLLVIAPATANTIAKLSHGLANDLLSTLYLAINCPVYIAPAMNQAMWHKKVTQENIQRLISHQVQLIGPESGEQACGDTGFGRMAEASHIYQIITQAQQIKILTGKNILMSAGPTREALDPVRYITNRSSGKMGYALAEAALNMGANVTLVSGPVSLTQIQGIKTHYVETAAQMHHDVISHLHGCDIYIGAAAVADYTPAIISTEKIKKQHTESIITLVKTKDILADVAHSSLRPHLVVGFAAETENLECYAKSKLQRKNIDMIAANWVGKSQGGFDNDDNALHVYWQSGEKVLPMTHKKQLAIQLMHLIVERYNAKNTT